MSIPRLAASHADWGVFGFTLAISLIGGILFGLAPAWGSVQHEPMEMLRESASRGSVGGIRNRLRSALVVGEVAVAVLLVAVGSLLTVSFVRLLRTDPGFEPDRVLASIIIASGDRYSVPARHGELFQHILDAVRTLPGVQQAGTVDALPFSGENHGGFTSSEESGLLQRGQQLVTELDLVSAEYLQAMGVRLVEGRWFRDDDAKDSRNVAIVNGAAAQHLFPGASSLGKRICINCLAGQPQVWARVVGVATSVHHARLEDKDEPEVYLASGALNAAQFLVVRTAGQGGDLARAIREKVAAVDPCQPVFLSATMQSLIADSVADRRFIMTLLGITGCLALLLSAAGVYGVVSYATSRRTKEIGVRMALGASPGSVLTLVFAQGMRLAAVGATIGLAAAVLSIRVLHSALAGMTGENPLWMAMAAGLVMAIASLACSIPARRATRIEPVAALRED
jgi:putative ABC transport system permease protein